MVLAMTKDVAISPWADSPVFLLEIPDFVGVPIPLSDGLNVK